MASASRHSLTVVSGIDWPVVAIMLAPAGASLKRNFSPGVVASIRPQHLERRRHHFGPDAVAGNDRNMEAVVGRHDAPLGQINQRQAAVSIEAEHNVPGTATIASAAIASAAIGAAAFGPAKPPNNGSFRARDP